LRQSGPMVRSEAAAGGSPWGSIGHPWPSGHAGEITGMPTGVAQTGGSMWVGKVIGTASVMTKGYEGWRARKLPALGSGGRRGFERQGKAGGYRYPRSPDMELDSPCICLNDRDKQNSREKCSFPPHRGPPFSPDGAGRVFRSRRKFKANVRCWVNSANSL